MSSSSSGYVLMSVAVAIACATAACAYEDPNRLRGELVESEIEVEDETAAGSDVNAVTNDLGDEELASRELDSELFEGDILLEESTTPSIAGNASVSKPWPGGVVPYTIDPALPSPSRVTDAIAHWQARTPIRFVERTTESAYVAFVRGTGCSSYIGRIGGKQNINLASGCDTGSVIHEIGHAVGLWHEQSRSDRDSYVRILLENVSPGHEHNFTKTTFTSIGTYDLGSIMHYGSTYFSANGKPTMTRRDGSLIVPQRSALSRGDIEGIAAIYGKAPPARTSTATTTDDLNLRSGPSTNDAVITVMPRGATVTRTGKSQSGFDAVTYGTRSGWAYAMYLK